jgi:hypothetical protein
VSFAAASVKYHSLVKTVRPISEISLALFRLADALLEMTHPRRDASHAHALVAVAAPAVSMRCFSWPRSAGSGFDLEAERAGMVGGQGLEAGRYGSAQSQIDHPVVMALIH